MSDLVGNCGRQAISVILSEHPRVEADLSPFPRYPVHPPAGAFEIEQHRYRGKIPAKMRSAEGDIMRHLGDDLATLRRADRYNLSHGGHYTGNDGQQASADFGDSADWGSHPLTRTISATLIP